MKRSILLLIIILTCSRLIAAEAYVVLSQDKTILTFYYDDEKASRDGTKYSIKTTRVYPGYYNNSNSQNVKKVVFDESFVDFKPKITYHWFSLQNLTSIEGMKNLDTSEVEDMSEMFYGCKLLETLDLSYFNTEKVVNMSSLFRNCEKLKSLDLCNFKTTNVTDMSSMFSNCSSLTSLDVSSLDTKNVTTMASMFSDCKALLSLDLSGFNTSNVTNMNAMFASCESIESLDISSFDTHNVTTLRSLFLGCFKIETLDVSSFNTESVTDMSEVFSWCTNLNTIYASNKWVNDKVWPADGRSLFYNCQKLVGGAGTAYSSYHIDYSYARIDGGSESPGYFTEKIAEESVNISIGRLRHVTMYYGNFNLLVPEGITATTYNVVDGNLQESKVYLEGDVIPQGTGVVLSGEPGTYKLIVTSEDGERDPNNKLRGTDEEEMTTGGDKYYVFSTLKGSNGDPSTLGFYYANGHPDGSAFLNGAHKAYLALTANQNSGAKSFFLINQTNAIVKMQCEPLEMNDNIYDLNGRPIRGTFKGILIVNGKKLLLSERLTL